MEDELTCNYRKCRKRLTSYAWVTSCSHIFCDADGTREFKNSLVCPACNNTLSGKLDVIRVDLKPSEQFKSMVLCGNRPETIMEICSRALSFWNYQCHQERVYLEHLSTKAKEKATQLEQYYEQVVSRLQSELSTLKAQITSIKKKHDFYENKCKEINVKLTEKSRQHQKLQALYEALRRKCVTPASISASDFSDAKDDCSPQQFMMHLSSRDEILGVNEPASTALVPQPLSTAGKNLRRSPPEREFIMRPNHTPLVSETRDTRLLSHFPLEPR